MTCWPSRSSALRGWLPKFNIASANKQDCSESAFSSIGDKKSSFPFEDSMEEIVGSGLLSDGLPR